MSIFKDTFHPSIKKQLEVRQNAMTNRTSQNLQYLNSRNAWIRMSSAVNIYKKGLPTDSASLSNPANYDNTLAKQYILQGGTLYNNKLRSGLTPSYNQGGAYSISGSSGEAYRLGIRPMPGITSVDVKSKSAYGSLREATVNFQCWDIKQLEDLELLYMRPGYTVLLEWGWSPYLGNDSSYSTTVDYTDIIDTKWDKEDLFKQQYARATDGIYYKDKGEKAVTTGYQGNAESMFGYVKNYNWKARQDGGYDCTVSIISIGEVIESLKVNYSPLNTNLPITTKGLLSPNLGFDASDMTELSSSYSQNILAGIFYELREITRKLAKDFKTPNQDGTSFRIKDNKYPFNYNMFHRTLEITGGENASDTIGNSKEQIYITLETLTNILNHYVLLQDVNNKKPFASVSVLEPQFGPPVASDPISGSGYLLSLAHPLQISIDPTVCLIKNKLWSDDLNIQLVTGSVDQNTGDPVTTLKYGTATIDRKWWENIATLVKKANEGEEKPLVDEVRKTLENKDNTVGNLKEIQRWFVNNLSNIKSISTIKDKTIGSYNNFFDLLNKNLSSSDALYSIWAVEFNKTTGINNITFVSNANKIIEAAKENPAAIDRNNLEREQQKVKDFNKKGLKGSKYLNKITYPYFIKDDYNSGLGIIGNIYVNINMLYNLSVDKTLASQDKKEKNEISLYDFLKNILSKISTATGNVNNFDIHVDPNGSVARIIDVNYVDRKSTQQAYDEAVEIQVHNLNSIVRSYSLESKIFPEQGTQVAIGAQIGGGALGIDSTTLVDYNRLIRDRILPIKDTPTSPIANPGGNTNNLDILTNSLATLIPYFEESIEKLKGFLPYVFSFSINPIEPGKYNVDNAGKYAGALRDIIQFFNAIGKSKTKSKAIIPTTLSLEMDGIGGIIIGNIFRINTDILPRGYKDGQGVKLGYVVTGLGHSLNNNDWVTKIDSQFILLDEPQQGEHINFGDLKLTVTPGGSGGGLTVTRVTGGTDKAKTYYPEKPEEPFRRTFISQTQLANYLKKKVAAGLNKNVAIAVMAKSISEQGVEDQLRGFNNNFYGVQTDSGRWAAKYDPVISGNVFIRENSTNKQRSFAAFSTPEVGADFVIENVQRRGIYVGGTTTFITRGTKVTDATLWARVYYKEWVKGEKEAEPDAAKLKNLLSIYDKAAKLIG